MKEVNLECICSSNFEDHIPDFYLKKFMPFQCVTSALEAEIPKWSPENPVMIDAPTGLGKTTFVKNVLLPLAQKHQTNILIVSNRIALSLQQKKNFLDSINSKYLKLLSDNGIVEQKIFENIGFVTYQGLLSFVKDDSNKDWIQNVEYLIADEAHFFTSDAVFNYNCNKILEKIVSVFHKAIRIYLTATSWDILYPLAQAEIKFYKNLSDEYNRKFYDVFIPKRYAFYYCFDRNYDQYNIHFFEHMDFLFKIISEDEGKWMIFLDQKARKDEFEEKFDGQCSYLDASRKNTKEFQNLISTESFEKKILLTTSVLDCGINIHDPALKNIVIFNDDRCSVMQMTGRKRLTPNETVNVWIFEVNKDMIEARKDLLNEYLTLENQFEDCIKRIEMSPKQSSKIFRTFISQLWNNPNPNIRNLFQIFENKAYKNNLAFFKINRKVNFYKRIIERKTTFRCEVEDWFQKPHSMPISQTAKLDAFYEKHEKKILEEGDKEILRELIISTYKSIGKTQARSDRNHVLGRIALNNLLKEIPNFYYIEKYGNDNWVLTKKDEKE